SSCTAVSACDPPIRAPHSGQKRLFGGSLLPQFWQLARGTDALLARLGPDLERAQRLGDSLPQRPDELAVVLVRDLARAVIELELFQGRERPVAVLGELELTALERAGRAEAILARGRLAQERQCDVQRAGSREDGAQNECECRHACAGARSSR